MKSASALKRNYLSCARSLMPSLILGVGAGLGAQSTLFELQGRRRPCHKASHDSAVRCGTEFRLRTHEAAASPYGASCVLAEVGHSGVARTSFDVWLMRVSPTPSPHIYMCIHTYKHTHIHTYIHTASGPTVVVTLGWRVWVLGLRVRALGFEGSGFRV